MTKLLKGPYGATPIHPDELLGLKLKHITTKAELNEVEAENIYLGLEWLDKRGARFDPLDSAHASELHRRLYSDVWDWAGDYRLTEKNVGVPVWNISTEMRMLLDDARHWVENSTFANPLEAGAHLHHRLVKIHPFPNGNGRWARIMADAFLELRLDHPAIDWNRGGDLQARGEWRSGYINALRAADGYNFDPLLAFVGLP